NIRDEVMQWLGAGTDDQAGDQQIGPKRRLPGAVGAAGLQERDVQLGAQGEGQTRCYSPPDDRREPPAPFYPELARRRVAVAVMGCRPGEGLVSLVLALGGVRPELPAERLEGALDGKR